ncbi:MAG TPA: hypothetical protein VKF42_08850 [Chitinivibrionales bacterium]|jgi:uncharacterized membrane protein YciS (DUF1049 family)|nr:hypothetical protein [Chitinivibrionales bacterium]
MVFVKWLLVFLLSFALAFIIIITFSQPEFQVQVSAHIFTYHTKALPVWAYVAGALGLGLIVGLGVAAYNFVTLRTALYKKDKRIRDLEAGTQTAQEIPEKFMPPQDAAGDDSF